jgi:stage V sporulation protein G
MEESEDRLRAFCSITIDNSFVIRDLKIIDGTSGPFVAMPSRKLAGHCQRCGYKNHLRASYCNHCGVKQTSSSEAVFDSPQKLYADVAHPINSECREMIQNAVLEEFAAELSRASQPGYRSRYDDEFDEDVDHIRPTLHRDDAALEPNRPHFGEAPARVPVRSEDDTAFGAGIF